jgi:hypothetical protein
LVIGDIVSVEKDKFVVKIRSDLQLKPSPGDFVGIVLDGGTKVVGVVSGMVHRVKEELLPYMDSEKVPKFLPYVEDYSDNLLIVTGLGILEVDGTSELGRVVPVPLKSAVLPLEDQEVLNFHDQDGTFSAGYLFRHRDDLPPSVGVCILERLEGLLPEEVGDNLKAAKRFLEGGGFR